MLNYVSCDLGTFKCWLGHFGECVIFGKMLNLSQQQQQQQQSLHALLYLHFSENLEMILIITHQQLQWGV